MVRAFSTPILLNVFNRPRETSIVLAVLQELKPIRLFVHCDGPRTDNESDLTKVTEVRKLIRETVTWPCDLHCLFEESNLGCGKGPANAINWFFSQVEEGIILEDDCCPHSDFFDYCEQLLGMYRDNNQIGIISGTCFASNPDPTTSYRFSAYAGIWGWATWRRTWNLFDFDFYKSDKDFLASVEPFLRSKSAAKYWLNILHKCTDDGSFRSYWDYQLHLSLLYANKINILPNKNLVSNIGFNENATHTFDQNSIYSNRIAESILPLIHPNAVKVNRRIDNREYAVPLGKRIKRIIKKLFKL